MCVCFEALGWKHLNWQHLSSAASELLCNRCVISPTPTVDTQCSLHRVAPERGGEEERALRSFQGTSIFYFVNDWFIQFLYYH